MLEWELVGLGMLAAAVAGGATFSAFALTAGTFSTLFAAASAFFARRRLAQLERRASPAALPPVTIIKPLKGEDPGLYENLASFCRQDYPCYQIVFCLQNPEDPALAVVERLRRAFPTHDLEVVVSKGRIGYNPKVNNMANAYPFAKYDLIMMSDSDIRVQPDFIRRMAAPFEDPGAGLATAFYQATGSTGLWGHLEALSINARFLPESLTASLFGMRFAMGAAMMVRRKAFEESGAYENLADHLADDWWLGESVREAGWKLEAAAGCVDSVPGISTGVEHFKHLTRWARTIRICQPAGYAASLIQHGFSLLSIRGLVFGFDPLTCGLLLAIWGAKAFASASVAAALGGRQPLRALWLLPLSEWFAFAAWVAGCTSNSVLWRGETFVVEPQGRLVPLSPALSARRPLTVEP